MNEKWNEKDLISRVGWIMFVGGAVGLVLRLIITMVAGQ